MADTLQFDLVSPERKLLSLEATEVRIPGAEGDLTALADHTPVITTLRPGVLTVVSSAGEQDYFVVGGFAEITPEATSVLAERAFAKADMSQDTLDEMVADATEARKSATPDAVDAAAKFLADLVAAGSQIGLTAKQSSL